MLEMAPLLITIIAFVSVTGVIFVIGRYFAGQAAISRRLPVPASTSHNAGIPGSSSAGFLSSWVGKIDERKFGIEGVLRSKLRRELIRAGYFSDAAIRFYIVARLGLVLLLPTAVFVVAKLVAPQINIYLNLLLVAVSALIGILGVDAYIKHRQGALQHEHRLVFPDLIDMLVVCTDAGLSLDAAFARIFPEVAKQSHTLAANLAIIGAETRAGRAMVDALDGFADRLNLDEARAFVIMLRQSVELGTDIGDALRVFSDEMRGKRLLRAEETANKLPVKMTLPLGVFIFPVILMVIMVPVVIKLLSVAQQMAR